MHCHEHICRVSQNDRCYPNNSLPEIHMYISKKKVSKFSPIIAEFILSNNMSILCTFAKARKVESICLLLKCHEGLSLSSKFTSRKSQQNIPEISCSHAIHANTFFKMSWEQVIFRWYLPETLYSVGMHALFWFNTFDFDINIQFNPYIAE